MKWRARRPDDGPGQLDVGSGDASVDGARNVRIDTGSGDVRATRVRGELAASLGSGDLEASDIGSLDLNSVGSGDAAIRNVGGASRIGSIGSGDVSIRSTSGPVEVGSVGSGDLDLADIGRSEEHTSELQSLMRTSYAVFCLKKKTSRHERMS